MCKSATAPVDTELWDELIALVAEVERAQRAEDVAAFLALFDDNATWVTGGGRRLVGLNEISTFTRAVLPGWTAEGASADYELVHAIVVADGVVATCIRQTYRAADGTPTSGGLPTYVWRRTPGGWRIIVGQNTGAARDDAGTVEVARDAAAAIVRDVETGLNTNDVELMTRHFGEDAIVINATGRRIDGKAAIIEAHEQALAGFMRNEHVSYSVTDVRALEGPVALVTKSAQATDANGAFRDPEPTMLALYVLHERDGRWEIVARQNTLVTSPPA